MGLQKGTLQEQGWEKAGGPRELMGLHFCGRRFVMGDGSRVVCHSLQEYEQGMKRRTHQVIWRGFLIELDDQGLLA